MTKTENSDKEAIRQAEIQELLRSIRSEVAADPRANVDIYHEKLGALGYDYYKNREEINVSLARLSNPKKED